MCVQYIYSTDVFVSFQVERLGNEIQSLQEQQKDTFSIRTDVSTIPTYYCTVIIILLFIL